MMQKEFKEPIFEFVKQISDLDKVISVTLFGSVAKWEASSLSDIDFLVVVSDTKIEKDVIKTANAISDKYNKNFKQSLKQKN